MMKVNNLMKASLVDFLIRGGIRKTPCLFGVIVCMYVCSSNNG